MPNRSLATEDPQSAFIEAACVPLDGWHGSGSLERADAILAAHPALASSDIYTSAILGDETSVRRFLTLDAASATAKGGPRGWDALTYLCFSRYLRLDRARSDGFVLAAAALLDAGASARTGWHELSDQPDPEWESALYGAAGVAHHQELTRLLLERGADPNDGEVAYHAPETYGNNDAMKILVESGKLTASTFATMLHRKLDWTDYDAVAWLLAHGADPNHMSRWGRRALHHALGRDSALVAFEILLNHNADPTLPNEHGMSAFAIAAYMGRADVLDLFERHGFTVALDPDAAFLAACARGDESPARARAAADPALVPRLQSEHGDLLANFAGAGNTTGVRLLLDLGFDINSRTNAGASSADTALHVAVWHERLTTVKLLIERGAPLEATNGHDETPLAVAVRSLVEISEWTPHSSVEIVAALLGAGALVDSVKRFPSGSVEADKLLGQYGKVS
jgi:ankyrin repeat protein